MIFNLNKNQSLSKQTDEELIARYQSTGDAKFAGELYNRYVHLVYGICLKYLKHKEESKDLAMVVFEKMLKKLRTEEIQIFKKWIYTVTKNQCLTYLRDKGKMVDQSADLEELEKKAIFYVEFDDFSRPIQKDLEEKRILTALSKLKPDQKKCMELFFYKNMSYKDIETNTGYTIKQVKSFLQNGKRKLKLILESSEFNIEK